MGGGGRSNSTSSASGGITPAHRRMSTNGDMGSPLGRGAASPSLLVRKQSSVGIGVLVQSASASNTPGGQVNNDGLESVDSQSSFAGTPTPSIRGGHRGDYGGDSGDGGTRHTATVAASSSGIVVTKALQDLLRRDANGRPILLKPIYNPYRSSERDEEASVRRRLRPHTLQLLQPLTFEEASQARDPAYQIRKSHEELQTQDVLRRREQHTSSIAAMQLVDMIGTTDDAERHDDALCQPPRQHHTSLRERMEFWRSREADQLEVFSRAAAAAVSTERVRVEDINKRERGILDKVEKVQKNAAAIQASRNYERQRMEDLKIESQCRVEMECLVNAEDAYRNRYTATEALLWAELVTTFE
jgi:hypothetical protein